LGTLAVDLSTSIGREKGSGRSLANRKIVLSIRYIFKE
jgi:hypothetical protein